MKVQTLFLDNGKPFTGDGFPVFWEMEVDFLTWMKAGVKPVGPTDRTILYLNPEAVAAVLVTRSPKETVPEKLEGE